MIKFLNKRFPTESFPKLIVHIYYMMISITFCYLYYHKFINKADFYGTYSSGGIYAVLKFEAIKPIQFRILIPFLFKAIQSVVFVVYPIGDKLLFFLITIVFCYAIQLGFRFILNEYFESGSLNNWMASLIIYPMMWNFVIMNGQFFFMDFSVLLVIILGFYCIIKQKNIWLLAVFFMGILNHPSVGYLIPAYLLFNYKALFKKKTIIYTAVMALLYIGTYRFMDYIFPSNAGYFIIFNLPRNLSLYELLPARILLRDAVFNFGGLHIFLIIFLLSGIWKRYMGPLLTVNFVIFPYLISILMNFSIEELRNYIAIIPFILILALLFLSSFENPFLKLSRKYHGGIVPLPGAKHKILYVTSNGGIHDYRFLEKIAKDYEVLLLHYAAKDLIAEIQSIPGLKIISKTPFKKSFPLLSEIRSFKEIVRDFRPDIIHSGYVWQVGILASYVDFHPHLSMVWGSDILTEPGESFIIKKIVNKVIRQADHIQCDADFVKQKIISDYKTDPGKITVFPWGIDLKTFSKVEKTESRQLLNLGEDKFIVIYNRHLEPVYNPLSMLEGFKKFAEGKKDALLLMLSDGSLKEESLKYISANGLDDKIKVIGSKPNAQIPFYLNSSDVYLSTSVSDGTSLSLLEAMGCGLAVVVTDVPAIKEWVGPENGILVPLNDPASVAGALDKYYNDRGLIIRHGEKNMEIASLRANWDKNYEMLRKIYSDLTVAEKKKS